MPSTEYFEGEVGSLDVRKCSQCGHSYAYVRRPDGCPAFMPCCGANVEHHEGELHWIGSYRMDWVTKRGGEYHVG